MATLQAVMARYRSDEAAAQGGTGRAVAEQRLAAALASIGWRAASDAPAEEVAPELAMIVAACVERHQSMATLYAGIANCLWQHAHHLDGGAAARSEWEPAAIAVVDRYAAG